MAKPGAGKKLITIEMTHELIARVDERARQLRGQGLRGSRNDALRYLVVQALESNP